MSMKGSGTSIAARVCLLALAALLPEGLLADGKVIPQRAFAIPQIPDQQALLHYANGTETLVIETTFVGEGTNFAWVVPLPAAARLAASVQVLNRQTTGLFDTVTLKSANPAALLDWLNENGFQVPSELAPVVADYVRSGWVFVAARLHDEAGGATPRATHPLRFTFPTSKPVYPLRLTGTGAGSCRIAGGC